MDSIKVDVSSPSKKSKPSVPQPNSSSATKEKVSSYKPDKQSNPLSGSRETSIPSPSQKRRHESRRSKTLYVGDSVSANVNFDALEKGMKTKIISAKAYSSIHDTVSNAAKSAARFPEQNFTTVIRENLQSILMITL